MLLAIGSASFSGCALHPHNETNARNAAAAEAKLAELANAASPSYAAMRANIEKFKEEEEFLVKEVNATALSALMTKLPSMSWGDVRARVQDAKGATESFAAQVAKEAGVSRKETASWEERKRAAEDAVKAAKKRLTAAKAKVEAWNKSIAALTQGLSKNKDDLSQLRKAPSFEALKALAQKAGDTEITFKDADGKDKTTKVKSELSAGLAGIVESFQRKDAEGPKSILPDAPGIGIILANLALETAKLNLSVAETELDYREQRAHLFEDAFAQVILARQLIDDVEEKVSNDVTFPAAGLAFTDIAKKWKDNKDKPDTSLLVDENFVAGTLAPLRKLVVAESIVLRNQTVFPVVCERLAHQHSISLSALNDETHQALFRGTMAGLRAYHEGGVRSSDVANFIRLAQAVATVSIADSIR